MSATTAPATTTATSVFANSSFVSPVEEIVCAICLDSVDISMNVIKTECKHCFHSNCFLQNAVHNGFNCPMCRNELAEVPSNDDDDDDDEDDDDDDDEEEVEDFTLRGARWLMMRAEGEEIDDDDTDDESIDSYDEEGFIRYEDESVPIVSIDQVTALLEQNNVSYKELVAFLILPDSRHQSDLQEYNNARMKQIATLCSSLNI